MKTNGLMKSGFHSGFAILLLMQTFVEADTVTVSTQYGAVRGLRASGVTSFLGIPFASPPTGDLRWRAPLPPQSWSSVNAFEFKPECSQMSYESGSDAGVYRGSEDCLYLNVWTPSGAVNRPVMVFIHGGGNQQGSASQQRDGISMYDGRFLAAHENVVVVTVQYRLGPLGYLVHPGLASEDPDNRSGNYGLLDLILALRYIKSNCAAFGGDSSRVLVFGESGGAVNTGLLVVSPLAANTFTRALIQSGAILADSYAGSEAFGISYLRDSLGCRGQSPQEVIASARALPPESLVAGMTSPLSGGVVKSVWGPVVDGNVIPENPLAAIEAGRFNRVPVVVGSNADEMSISTPVTVTPLMVNLLLRATVPPELVEQGLKLYPPGTTNAQARASYVAMTTDAQFTAGARRIARAVASQGSAVYRYFFTHAMSGIQRGLGAFHGIELFYIFRTLPLTKSYGLTGRMTSEDTLVMNAVSRYWARFALTGDPNDHTLPSWPSYELSGDPYLELKPVPVQGSGVRTEQCDFWDAVQGLRTNIHALSQTPVPPRGRSIAGIVLVGEQAGSIRGKGMAAGLADIRGRIMSAAPGKRSPIAIAPGIYLPISPRSW